MSGVMKKQEGTLLPKSALKTRGWTESLITRFFPTPTKVVPNPCYCSGSPMKLYDEVQVIAIESTVEFQATKSAAAQRGLRAKAAAACRRATTIQWAKNLSVPDIPKYSREKLRELACKHYNNLWSSRGEDKYADPNANGDFLDRISVNFLRHVLSPYEDRLIDTHKLIGASEARAIIRLQILSAISQTYPWLSEECLRQ